jgi:hypothetical protein
MMGLLLLMGHRAAAEEGIEAAAARESLDEAWWTGPIGAASAATLPQGHVLVEPYLYDAIAVGRYDSSGTFHRIPKEDDYRSLSYTLYGLTDRLTLGLIPHLGYNQPSEGTSSTGVQLGDTTLQAQYRLTQFHEHSLIPTLSIVVGESLPTGRYDHLGDRPSDGLGSGAYTTTLALYAQDYFWMPNGRIVRTRLDLSYADSPSVGITGSSVYGTANDFRGRAQLGLSFTADSAYEYSVTRNWVLALDVIYSHNGQARLSGRIPGTIYGGVAPSAEQALFPVSVSLSLIPAIEYNWRSTRGIIFGTEVVAAGRNTTALVIPVVAVNFVF